MMEKRKLLEIEKNKKPNRDKSISDIERNSLSLCLSDEDSYIGKIFILRKIPRHSRKKNMTKKKKQFQ